MHSKHTNQEVAKQAGNFLMKTYNMHFLLTMHHSFLCLTYFWLFHPYAKSQRFTLNIQILINIDPTVIQYSLTHCCYWNTTKMLIWVLKSCFHINVPHFKMLLNLVAISISHTSGIPVVSPPVVSHHPLRNPQILNLKMQVSMQKMKFNTKKLLNMEGFNTNR